MLEVFALAVGILATGYFLRRWIQLRRVDVEPPPGGGQQYRESQSEGVALQGWLRTLGIQLPLSLIIACTLMLALFVISLFLTLLPEYFALAVIAAFAVLVIAFVTIGDLASWRIRRVETGLAECLNTIRASLVAGFPPRQAIEVAAQSTSEPLKAELGEVASRLKLGLSADQSVSRMLTRYNSEGTRLFAQSLIAHYQSGSNYAAMLASVSQLMHERIRQRAVVVGQLSGARYAAIFSGLLPYLLIPLLLWQSPSWFDSLLNHPHGITYLGTAVVLQIVGVLWLRKILRSEL
nr:type II secretion system F family protein [Pseudomaricurvus alcaniphilus]